MIRNSNPDDFDVIIVGAGLSGIGAAWHLQDQCPDKRYLILEARDALGGTWDLFRYPGIRSDSDMHTLGYNFRPWREAKAIADGPSILNYVSETARESGIDRHIRLGHRVVRASWSSAEAAWTVEAQRTGSGDTVRVRGNFLMMCSGYYSYEGGYTPEFPGRERFRGDIIHPQDWPENLDYRDRKVVIIGSGATAMTLVPAMAKQAAHVTMLQRSPTYVVTWPDVDRVANFLRRVLPERVAYAITRWKNTAFQQIVYHLTRRVPGAVKWWLLRQARRELGPGIDVETHFTPTYNPWDQRICLVPNADLFKSLRSGAATVVTDHIASFTETGIALKSGQTLEADIIVTATGLELVALGGAELMVDGHPVVFADTFIYKGLMYSDVPNLTTTFGYINASWTLRADLNAEYVCRLLKHMDKTGCRQCTPRLRDSDRDMPARPWIDAFSSGYLQRVIHDLPKQGNRIPWTNPQNYRHDKKLMRRNRVDDGVLQFTNPGPCRSASQDTH